MTQLGLPPSHGTFTSAASVAYASSRRMPYRSRGRPAGMRVPAEAFFDFKKADNWHLNIGQIPPAAGVLARRRLSVMVLRNPHPDATRFSAALSMIEIFDLGEPCVTPIRQLPHPYCVVDRIRGGRPRSQCGWPEPTPRACVRAQSAFFRAQSARNPPVADWSGKPFA